MALQDIEEFLAREAQFDSSGSFTLDEQRSLEKLAEFQAERPGLWLVKLLQAAVASGSSEFRVRQFVHDTRVTFEPNLALDWESWSQASASNQPGTRHLQLALQAASTMPGARLSLKVATRTWQVERGASRVPWGAGPGPVEVVRRWDFQLSLVATVRRSRLLVDEALLLQELGRYAPLPIWLDGRLLNDPVINKPPGLRLGVYVPPLLPRPKPAIPYTSLERLVISSEPTRRLLGLMDHSSRIPKSLELNQKTDRTFGNHLFLQQWSGPEWLQDENWRERLRGRTPGFRHFDSRIERNDGLFEIWSDYNRGLKAILVKGYLSLDINRGRSGRLYLVKDGLLMKPKMLNEALWGVLIIWSAPELSTDLSQLQVVEDEVYQEMWRTLREHLSAAVDSLERTLTLWGLGSAQQAEYRERASRVRRYLKRQAPA
ncbi:MAG: hypothetical protein KIS61_25245 [Candidatus Eremiobacteraeota bacterium]|nr:hypothetical protein [Candidatus Eremiobacteraeota bacterium]